MIAGYNGGEPYAFKNIMMQVPPCCDGWRYSRGSCLVTYLSRTFPVLLQRLIGKGLNMRGFLVSEFESMADEFYSTVPKSLADGTFKSAEEVRDGLASTPQSFSDMLSGLNKGKVVIKVADPTKSHL
jgi:hypothetical protein